MRALTVAVAVALCLAAATVAPAEDRIMVQVGTGVVTYADLQDEARYWRLAEVEDDRMERLFFALLDRRVLLAHLRDLPVTADDRERASRAADATITRLEQRYGGVEALHAMIVAYDWDLMRLRAFLEARSLENTRLRRTILARATPVTDADVDAFVAEREAGGLPSDYFRLRQVVIRPADPASPLDAARARERALDARIRLRAGEPFEQVAAEVSDDPLTRLAGGYVGVMTNLELRDELRRALEPLGSGQVSHPVEIDGTWYIVEVLQRRTPEQSLAARRFEQARRALFADVRPKVPLRFVDAELRDLGFEARYLAYAARQLDDAAATADDEGESPAAWFADHDPPPPARR